MVIFAKLFLNKGWGYRINCAFCDNIAIPGKMLPPAISKLRCESKTFRTTFVTSYIV